jgi:DNA repair protein RadC
MLGKILNAIKELNNLDKPREKLLKKGTKALQNYELMAVLLGTGTKGKDVIKLSKEIIKLFENDFESLEIERLLAIHGLGKSKSSQILASIELSRRYLIKQNKKISSSKEVYEHLKEYHNKQQEYFLTIYLDGANHIVDTKVITIGTLNQSLVHPREVFSYAIEKRCASIIVAHNHPSSILRPSTEDINITKRLEHSAKILGIELLDHVILTREGFYSFKEEGFL